MKKTFKGFLACMLALMLIVSAFAPTMAETMAFDGNAVAGETASRAFTGKTLEAKKTASVDLSGIRNGKTFKAAEVEAKPETQPTDIVTIMVELDGAPAADVISNLKAAGDYRQQLVDAQNAAIKQINAALSVNIVPTHHYSVLFNGFAFDGEYRLVEEINEMGYNAFVSPVWENPTLFNSVSQVGGIDAWELGYTGEGYAVAILDTGCKVDHEAFSVEPEGVQFTRDDIASIIASGMLQGSGSTMNVNNVYVNAKIPFRWNYYYNHADVAHPGQSDHGTHVAGIAAGNGGEIQGVAPDAQLCIMQVFAPTGGASWSNIVPALEDAAVLGVAAANLSLGSPCGTETPYNVSYLQTLDRCVAAGVNLAMAAGNDYDSTFNNYWGGNEGMASYTNSGYGLVQDPDLGVVGSPSTWPHSVSVAAVSNSKQRFYYVTVEGQNYSYSENADNPVKLRDALGGQTVEYVMVPGFGTVEDFASVNVQGKVALVSRGEINFVTKAENAEAAGAVACIVYNNVDEAINMVAYEGGHIPHVIISKTAGAALAAAANKTMLIGQEQGIFDNPSGNMTTSFSSRGLLANLGIKPEVTAPGGQIYSATDPRISGTLYATWDGTSMATPHVCGGMAIISEYVDENFPNLSAGEKQLIVDQILMSTATPIASESGEYAPVHEQGAGLMNLKNAVTTKAYLTVEGTQGNRPKLELGDDPEKTGEMTMTFKVHNFGDAAQVYTVAPTVLINDIAQYDVLSDGTKIFVFYGGTMNISGSGDAALLGDANESGNISMADAILIARMAMGLIDLDAPCDLNGDGKVGMADAILVARIAMGLLDPMYGGQPGYVDFDMPETVTVPAGGEATVTVSAVLNDEIKHYLDTYYTTGALIEGFIELIPENEEDVVLGVPFVKYYGDWNYPATFDRGFYYEDEPVYSNNYPNTIGYRKSGKIYGLGINPYVETANMSYYLADRNAISPNNDGLMDTINLLYFGLLRNSEVRYVVCDAEGNELETISNLGAMNKGFWDNDHRTQLGVTEGMFPGSVNFAQYGDEVIVRVEAKFMNNGAHGTNPFTPAASEAWKWDVPVSIDTNAPAVANFAANANTFTFDVHDDRYVAYVGVYTQDGDALGEVIAEQGIFETERDVTTAISINGANNAYVVVADYAMNEQVYSWDGTTLTPVEGVQPPAPLTIPELNMYAYGSNLNTQTWIRFSTGDLNSLYYGGGIQSDDGDYRCGTYTGRYVYAITGNKQLVRYDASDIDAWSGKTVIGTLTSDYTFHEMAYNKATGKLYAVCGVGELYEVNPDTAALTPCADPQYGIVAMDFDREGNCYIVDAFGYLASYDIASGTETGDIAEVGVMPVDQQQGSFFPQCGTLAEGVFFWFAAPATAQYYADMHLYAISITDGQFIDMGAVYEGLYTLAMFAYTVEPPVSSINPVDFYDNFDGPFNWETLDEDGDGKTWETKYFEPGLYQDGSKCAVSYSWQDEVLHPDNWMISPEFEVGEGQRYLNFFTASANPATGDISEHYQVLIVPQGAAPQDGTVVYETIMDTNACTEHVIDISAFAGQTVQIAFRHFDCYDQYTLIIDSVGVGTHK